MIVAVARVSLNSLVNPVELLNEAFEAAAPNLVKVAHVDCSVRRCGFIIWQVGAVIRTTMPGAAGLCQLINNREDDIELFLRSIYRQRLPRSKILLDEGNDWWQLSPLWRALL